MITKNIGVYGGIQWDISDRTTLSAEVRRQSDDNTSLAPGDVTFNDVAESTQPRVAVTHALDENWSAYAQYSTGTNPAGVNLPFTDETMAASLAAANAAGHVDYDASDVSFIQRRGSHELRDRHQGWRAGKPSAARRGAVYHGLERHHHGRQLRLERRLE